MARLTSAALVMAAALMWLAQDSHAQEALPWLDEPTQAVAGDIACEFVASYSSHSLGPWYFPRMEVASTDACTAYFDQNLIRSGNFRNGDLFYLKVSFRGFNRCFHCF